MDGDEVYPKDSLDKIVSNLQNPIYEGYGIAWKCLYVLNGVLTITECIPNGVKFYNPKSFYYKRAWPREVLVGEDKEPKGNTDIWCWHGKLLKRSSIEPTSRRKKRLGYANNLVERGYTFSPIEKFPWDNPQSALYEEI